MNNQTSTTPQSPIMHDLRNVIFYEVNGVIILITNIPLIYAILSQHRLRSLHNLMICSMNFCAIFFGLFYCLPYVLTVLYSDSFLCYISTPIRNFLTIAISLHLCLISVDKALIIGYPLRYPSISKSKSIAVIVSLIWSISLIVGFYPITYRTQYLAQRNLSCRPSVALVHEIPYHWFYYSILICFPILCMTISYGYIYCIAMQQWKKIMDHEQLVSHDNIVIRKRHRISVHLRTAMPLLAITGAFLIMHIPFYIVSTINFAVLSIIGSNPSAIFVYSSLLSNTIRAMHVLKELAFAYPAVNPLLYAYFDVAIRQVVVKVFRVRRDRSMIDTRRTTAAAIPLHDPKPNIQLPNREQFQPNPLNEAIIESCGHTLSS